MAVDPTTTKYMIKATIQAEGIVEKSDIIGAIFGQTEGLMGNELDLRDLQKSARIGRIEVDVDNKGGKTSGNILLPSALDKVESAILAAGIETIDRIGPCKATIRVEKVEDTRIAKRKQVVDRAKALLQHINEDPGQDSQKISDEVRSAVQVAEITKFRNTRLPAGPNVDSSESVIIVEGRNDVFNLLKCGIKNAVGIDGTSVPKEIIDLSKEKTTIIFIDGDRGGELIAKELLSTCDVDFVARAPNTREVEELPHKLVMKCLKNKVSADQFISQHGLNVKRPEPEKGDKNGEKDAKDSKADKADKPARKERPERQTPERSGKEDGAERGKDDKGRGRRGRRSDDDGPREGRDSSRDAPRGREPKDETPKVEAKARPDDPRANFRAQLDTLSGSLKAVLLDDAGSPVKSDLAVRELADTLKGSKDSVHAVVFDGVITQRLLDIAAEKKINTVVGVKMGNVTKVPDAVEILTRDDLS